MMELIIVACLQTSPLICDERSIGLYPHMNTTTCLTQAQQQIAVWSEVYPGLRVERFTCRDSRTRLTKA